ncbi:MAG: MMPL family transporter [Gammaproteobacteria bacterium]|nr:MMPL family transporter [Gammaproteobacteria bacterium]
MSDGFFNVFSRRAGLSAVVSVLLVVVFGSLVRAPTFSGSMVNDIIDGNSEMLAAAEISAARGNRESVMLIVGPGDISVGAAFDELRALEDSFATAGIDATFGSLDSLRDQLFVFGLTPESRLSELLSALRSDVSGATLVSRDGTLFATVVTVHSSDEARAVALLRSFPFSSALSSNDVLAAVALEQDVAAGLRDDLALLIPAIVLVMLLTLLLAFRHWRAVLLPAFASLASATVVFSLLTLTGISINLVTLLALPIVLIVALANSCHFLAKSAKVRDQGLSLDEVVAVSMRRVATPYLVSCVTTAVALLSLAFNEITPIRDLGVLSAASLVVSFVLVFLFAPWALHWHMSAIDPGAQRSVSYRRASRWVHKKRNSISLVLVALAFASALTVPGVAVRSDARLFFPDDAAFTEAFRAFESRFYVFSPLRVLVRPDESLAQLDALRIAGAVRDRLRDDDAALLVGLEPAAVGSGFVITAVVETEDAAARLATMLKGIQRQGSFDAELVISSAQLVYESIDRQALASLAQSLSFSVVIIFGAIALLFRSARAVLASLVANAVPLLMVFGAVWLVGDPLNLVTAFVFLVALGVIVDDTIHILYRHHGGEEIAGSSIEFSVVLSTIMLCLGLLLCQLSDFPTTRLFALYCALALTGAVVSDLTLLPALLRYRGFRQSTRSSQ